MVSSFIDSLRLVFSDKYEISDSDYVALSDILISRNLSGEAFDSGLVQIIDLMIEHDYRFPITLSFLRELWESKHITYNFVKMLSGILKNGIISLRKMKRENVIGNDNITKSNLEDFNEDLIVVIYGSPIFNEILDEFKSILNRAEMRDITEGVSFGVPKKVKDIVVKSSKLLKNMNINIDLESFTSDDVLKSARLNLVITDTSDYVCGDSVILRTAKKHIKGKYVKGLEAYKEDRDSIFLGIDLDTSENTYSLLSDGIYGFIEELELEGV